jgi:tRNA 2-thiouridine synthesizing protein A
VLRTRKALAGSEPGDVLIVECTDPLAGVDIPNFVQQTGDTLEGTQATAHLMKFRILKR